MDAFALLAKMLPMDIDYVAGQNIKRRRQELGMTQEDLGHKAGISTVYLSEVERGLKSISLKKLHAVADALGVEAYTLLIDPKKDPEK